jgi:glycosyltransferase involved in cell wall biosynthesis
MNTQRSIFSVVMVTYNHENYIRRALESVLCQSEISDVEILIGDDGSTDGTVEILKEYAIKYDFIHVYAHSNVGLSKNVYDLFTKASGEYIAVLEGDDYWIDSEKLKKQKSIIDSVGCVATASNSLIVDNGGNKLGYWNTRGESKILTKGEVLYYQTKLFHPSAVMFKNIFFNSGDRFIVIANASRMGGNHSGLINLLANSGGIFLDKNAMTVWRFIQVEGGKNYSSQKVDNIDNFYASMRKYELYDKAFDFNYERHIYDYYHACKSILRKEVFSNIGAKRYYIAKIKFVIHKIIIKLNIYKY